MPTGTLISEWQTQDYFTATPNPESQFTSTLKKRKQTKKKTNPKTKKQKALSQYMTFKPLGICKSSSSPQSFPLTWFPASSWDSPELPYRTSKKTVPKPALALVCPKLGTYLKSASPWLSILQVNQCQSINPPTCIVDNSPVQYLCKMVSCAGTHVIIRLETVLTNLKRGR